MLKKQITYDDLHLILDICGSARCAGEVHGLLCSHLSVNGKEGIFIWYQEILHGIKIDENVKDQIDLIFDNLVEATWHQLVERQSEFILLLPDDIDSAVDRANAMAKWCEGFLYGLVSGKNSSNLNKILSTNPIADIISDVVQIARVKSDDKEDVEVEESAYTELNEYLRVAIQLIYEELSDFRSTLTVKKNNASEVYH